MLALLTFGGCAGQRSYYDPLNDPLVKQAVERQCDGKFKADEGHRSAQELGIMSDCDQRVITEVQAQERKQYNAEIDREVAPEAHEKAQRIWAELQANRGHDNPFSTDLYFSYFGDGRKYDRERALILAVAKELRETYHLTVSLPGYLTIQLPSSEKQ
jgi:hypothetical protein